jgi:hypothetical protein
MTTANSSFDRVASTTLKNYQKQLADNVSDHIPLLKLLRSKGAVKVSGGDTIVRPLMHEFANAQSYSGSDVIDVTKQDGISAAEYNWKQVVCPIVVEGIEKARNMGETQVLDLMEALTMQAEMSLADKVSEMIFGDGTGNSGKDMLGLQAIVSDTPTTGTLGGINAANESFWRNEVNTSVGSFASNGLTEMSTMMRNLTRGVDRPDVIVCDTTQFGRLETVANGRAEFSNPALADQGFRALKFQGVDVIFDDNCPSDHMYLLNTKNLKLYIHRDNDFSVGPFIEPANQDVLVAKVKLYAQLTTNRRNSAGALSGFSA